MCYEIVQMQINEDENALLFSKENNHVINMVKSSSNEKYFPKAQKSILLLKSVVEKKR